MAVGQQPAGSGKDAAREVPRAAAPTLDAIYDQEAGRVFNVLRRLGVPEADLEDATHDVFLVVHRNLASYDATRPLRPWVTGIAVRVAANHRRRVGRRREDGGTDLEQHPVTARNAEQLAQAGETRAMVQDALAALDENQREVLVLHEVEGHSMPDIARALEVPVNTLYSRLRLARAHFTRLVQRLQPGGGRP